MGDSVLDRARSLAESLEGITSLMREETGRDIDCEGQTILELAHDAENKIEEFITWYKKD